MVGASGGHRRSRPGSPAHSGADRSWPAPTTARCRKSSAPNIEDDLKSGRLRCVVATSSLELGIDMGAVDLVIQVESPPSVASGLQRVGRAGHQVGEISKGVLFPKHRADLLHTTVASERMRTGLIEAIAVPQNPLDILAQQTVAAVALDTLEVEDWWETVRRSAPFATLPRSAFEATLDLLVGPLPVRRVRRAAAAHRVGSRGRHDRRASGRAAAGRHQRRHDPRSRHVRRVHRRRPRDGARRVGELDEEMVYESRVGDVFALGATSWRIEEITSDRVLVSPGVRAARPRAVLEGRRTRAARRAGQGDRRVRGRAGAAGKPARRSAASRRGSIRGPSTT